MSARWVRLGAGLWLLPAPAHAEAWPDEALEGASAYEAGRFAEARQKYEHTVLEGETRPEIVYNLGAARYRAADGDSAGLAQALADFRRAGAGAGTELRGAAAYNAATMQALLGELDAAIEGYRDVLRQNPADQEARYNLELLQRIKESQPPQPEPQKEPGDEENEPRDGEKPDEQPRDEQQGEQKPQQEEREDQGEEQPEPGEENAPQESEPGGEQEASGQSGEEPVTPEEASTISVEEALRQLDKLEEAEREHLRQLLMRHQRRADVDKDW